MSADPLEAKTHRTGRLDTPLQFTADDQCAWVALQSKHVPRIGPILVQGSNLASQVSPCHIAVLEPDELRARLVDTVDLSTIMRKHF